MLMHASCLAVGQALVAGTSVVMVNLQANTLLTVTAITPHTLALLVQTQATVTSNYFLSHTAQMFRLEFFTNTVLLL
jgi:hypothetical protein